MPACHNSEKFRQHLQTSLSQKLYIFFEIFIVFLQSTENLPHFEEKDQLHSLNILEVIDSEKCGYLNPQKSPF